MLKKRLIPSLLVRDGNIVQSVQFKHTNVIGNVITAVDFFNGWAVDEILILDVSKNNTGRELFTDIVNELSERCFVPLTAGGWITRIEHIEKYLSVGADKVIINTYAYDNPEFINEAASIYGSQCIVVSIDVRKHDDGHHYVYTNRGTLNTDTRVELWAKGAQEAGAGEILLTSIDNDGMRNGYDLGLIKKVGACIDIPLICFGGVGQWQHMVDAIEQTDVGAVSAGNIFHFTEHSTKNAKEYLMKNNVKMRETVFFKVSLPRKPRYRRY